MTFLPWKPIWSENVCQPHAVPFAIERDGISKDKKAKRPFEVVYDMFWLDAKKAALSKKVVKDSGTLHSPLK